MRGAAARIKDGLKWRWEPGLKKREGTNGHIFSDLRNTTIAYIRMVAGV